MASTITEFAHLRIPLEQVLKATNNFHHDNIISQGDFGPAYRGQLLRSGKLIKIAARRLDHKRGLGDSEFWTEVSMLSDLNHTNLISIIGFCDDKVEKIIVTTYAKNGSLGQFLNSPNLTWTQRLRICVGVARALSYLHYDEGRSYGVIHRNINSSTILLDENFEAKLSGFEISIKQSVNRMEQVIPSEPIGIIGYVDPALEKIKGVTYKSDIYAFGVVLFEILCGRKAYNEEETNRSLNLLAKFHYENKTMQDIIHPDLQYQMSPRLLDTYLKEAYCCLKEEPAQRPNMNHIVPILEKALKLHNLEKNLEHLKIRLDDIKLATHNFSDTYMIENGGDYMWYKAEVDHFDKEKHSSVEGKGKGEPPKRCNILVLKRFDGNHEELILNEIEMLTSAKHRNIVTLLGFCVEGYEMIIVIENFSNGNLFEYLGNIYYDKRRILTWEKRLKICIDVARALHYLHFEMEEKKIMIQNAIKCYSIGLDENWGAKIVGFWNAKFHYEDTSKLKRESDVYSFGIVLLEILCGRCANDPIYFQFGDKGLAELARRNLSTGTLWDMIDPIIKEETSENNFILNRGPNKDSLNTFFQVANQCVVETQDQRPTMKVVLKELEKALLFQEEGVQQPDKNQVVDELEKATHEIPEEGVQLPNMDGVADEPEKTLEVRLTRVIEKNLEHLKIRLNDIKLATNNFSHTYKIPSSGNYRLYRAELDHFDEEIHLFVEGKNKGEHPKSRNTVVIKRYPSGHHLLGEEEFFIEIEILTGVKHPNIVTLLGFCVEGSEMILILEDFSNKKLGQYLENVNDRRILTWEKRLKICIDVANALNYLHSEIEDQKMIINRNIKSGHIGLDKNWGAKIYGFAFSIFLPPNQEDEALYLKRWRGTKGYIDPEYKKTYKLKRESDVYSFGVVLFEMLCGRLAYDPIYIKEGDEGLAYVARRNFYTGTVENMIDPLIKEETSESNFVLNRGPNKDSLQTFIKIAHQCVTETQDQRPTMKVVVKELEKALLFLKNNKDNPRISLENINQATQNFHNDNCIGGGGFGRVYKGNLQDRDGTKTIVAKRLDTRLGQGEQQFLSELQILLEYKHQNVIGLVGYCDEKDEKIIVYEYAPRGSLDRYLNDASLTWVKRLNICIDVASALCFLHEGGAGKQAKVIHRDIKTANILLNHDWKAKLADFGLSLISPLFQEKDYVIDHTCGTHGYLDPLYKKSGFLTIESDIYSFGVVLFEILYGRSVFAIQKHEGYYLPDFSKNNFNEGNHYELVFEQIREQVMPKSLTTFQEIAYQCLHHEREKRPTTKKVLMQLKKAMEFQNMASIMTKFTPLRIPLEDIVKATNNFHGENIIGHRGFSSAYKGRLLHSGKLMNITARRFDCKHAEADLEFLMEISVLSDINHTNLVSVIGFCDEKDEKITVTTYEANGSLARYLDSSNLTWTQRLRICVGVARALRYLHHDEGRDYAIIHCNINSDTILLDENHEAKLSGFEFSIKQSVYHKDQVCFCEHIGTMEFMDPAIEKTGSVNQKSDIYSFGVVLFEMLCGRKAFIQNESNRFLAPFAIHHYENGTINDIIHPDLWNQISLRSLFKYSKAAYSCLKEERAHRPNANNIVDTLEKALDFQLRHENSRKKLEHLKIRLTDIKLATNDFSETYQFKLDIYYAWYRGELDLLDKENSSSREGMKKDELPKRHNTVVIKRILARDDELEEQVFFTELDILTSVKHRGIITLVGFCIEGPEMILVIENAYNGYLADYFKNVNYNKRRILTWKKRLKICIDVARTLNYLHSEMEDQKMIILAGIDSYSIVLDEKWGAKIVWFGNSKFLPLNKEDESLYLNLRPHSSYHLDPQYEKTRKLKKESDVYSFGVVLLEILCGRFAYDPIYLKKSDKGLAHIARQSFYSGTLEEMIDPILKEETKENIVLLNRGPNKDSLLTFITIAHQCVTETQDQRPTMKIVVKELEKALFFSRKSIF